jgi:hypothetical protein
VDVQGRKVLVLGGYGLVGMAVCRELLERRPRELQIHSLRRDEAEAAVAELAAESAGAVLSVAEGNIFDLHPEATGGLDPQVLHRVRRRSQIAPLDDPQIGSFLLYRLLLETRPDIVVDCVNTATGIAYRNVFQAAETLTREMEAGAPSRESVDAVLEALYVPRLIRHVQVMYRGLEEAGTRVYVKIGTTGTGGMGLNIPYTHSEERPSRQLMSKSALAGAHSMLLFLLGRTPGGPQVKEIKPAAAIGWKRIAYGPLKRPNLERVTADPRPVPERFSSFDPTAARLLDEPYENVFIDTGENGQFALEEFATVTSEEQMEFVTPEEIARYAVLELEGRSTGYDIIGALDGAALGPTYRAGVMRHHALARMSELEERHGVHSVAFEMLGPPRVSKLLFEAHLLRQALGTLKAVADTGAEEIRDRLDRLVREHPREASDVISVGLPVLLDSGELIRGRRVLVPGDADDVAVTPEALESWAADGWVDLRLSNCERWRQRCRRIRDDYEAIPAGESSSRFVRDRRFWADGASLQPGKVVGWILSVEEGGMRLKR